MCELVITCAVCGTMRSISHLPEEPNLNDTEVLSKAGHTPDCPVQAMNFASVQKLPQTHTDTISYQIGGA